MKTSCRAIADFIRVIGLNPKDSRADYKKAELLDKAGKKKEALGAYQSFLKYAPPQAGDFIQRAQARIKALRG